MENSELISYLKTVDTATLANAIELLNLRPRSEGFASLDLRCLFPEFGPMCGYAVTAQVETVSLGAPRTEEAYVELFEAVEASPKPAVLVMQEIGGDRDRATHAGEVMATIFTRLGAIGLVSDCGVRDLTGTSAFITSPAAPSPATPVTASSAPAFRSRSPASRFAPAICCMPTRTVSSPSPNPAASGYMNWSIRFWRKSASFLISCAAADSPRRKCEEDSSTRKLSCTRMLTHGGSAWRCVRVWVKGRWDL
jgi:regulator of RNase E activity RraA